MGKKIRRPKSDQPPSSQEGRKRMHTEDLSGEAGRQVPGPNKTTQKAPKQFKCSVCSKEYVLKGALRNHVLVQHPGFSPSASQSGQSDGARNVICPTAAVPGTSDASDMDSEPILEDIEYEVKVEPEVEVETGHGGLSDFDLEEMLEVKLEVEDVKVFRLPGESTSHSPATEASSQPDQPWDESLQQQTHPVTNYQLHTHEPSHGPVLHVPDQEAISNPHPENEQEVSALNQSSTTPDAHIQRPDEQAHSMERPTTSIGIPENPPSGAAQEGSKAHLTSSYYMCRPPIQHPEFDKSVLKYPKYFPDEYKVKVTVAPKVFCCACIYRRLSMYGEIAYIQLLKKSNRKNSRAVVYFKSVQTVNRVLHANIKIRSEPIRVTMYSRELENSKQIILTDI